jgi:hypothetical protein
MCSKALGIVSGRSAGRLVPEQNTSLTQKAELENGERSCFYAFGEKNGEVRGSERGDVGGKGAAEEAAGGGQEVRVGARGKKKTLPSAGGSLVGWKELGALRP